MKLLPIAMRGNSNLKAISLTFDDGPNPYATPVILDILKKENCKATFFLIGQRVESYPDIVQRILNEGHTVGGHSHKHGGNSGKDAYHEFILGNKSIEHISSKSVDYVRVPQFKYRKIDDGILRSIELLSSPLEDGIKKKELKVIDCSIDSYDWISWMPVWIILLKIRLQLHSGAIICLHDGSEKNIDLKKRAVRTIRMLPKLINMIRSTGYEIVEISKLELEYKIKKIKKAPTCSTIR